MYVRGVKRSESGHSALTPEVLILPSEDSCFKVTLVTLKLTSDISRMVPL